MPEANQAVPEASFVEDAEQAADTDSPIEVECEAESLAGEAGNGEETVFASHPPPFASEEPADVAAAVSSADMSGVSGAEEDEPLEPELELLRSLIMQREIDKLKDLSNRIEDPLNHAREMSAAITEALILRSGKDKTLDKALEPLVEGIFKSFLQKRPQDVVAVFFPIIGATIRRSIAESLRSMMEGFNKSLELSFSLKGLRWRLEALRAGKPFSEIVLLHTLLYRVEQAFLIHTETGLVLAHVSNEGVEAQDASMVSAMLTAIQDFVKDCFASNQEGHLESLRRGDYTIFVEHSPQAYLACVVRGTPPEDFRTRMSANLEVMLVECAEAFNEFNGDDEPFQRTIRHLEDCLITQAAQDQPAPWWLRILPWAVLAAAIGLGAWSWYDNRRAVAAHREKVSERHEILESGLDAFRLEPGYQVVEVIRDPEFGKWKIFSLKDDLARPYEEVLRDNGLTPDDYIIVSTPYISYHKDLVQRRVEQKIRPLPTVSVSLDDNGVLTMQGTAPMGWILLARQTALGQPGIADVDISALTDPNSEVLAGLVREVEATSVLFPMGKAVPEGEEAKKLAFGVDKLVELERLARSMGMSVSVTVYGHADAIGNDRRNYELSQERAKTLAAMLYARGSSMPVTMYGMGADYADRETDAREGDQNSRRIELRVHLTHAADANLEQLQGGQQ